MPVGSYGAGARRSVAGQFLRGLSGRDAKGLPAQRVVLPWSDAGAEDLHHLPASAVRMAAACSATGRPRTSGAAEGGVSEDDPMNPSTATLSPDETPAVLSVMLRELYGDEARLADWAAHPVSK